MQVGLFCTDTYFPKTTPTKGGITNNNDNLADNEVMQIVHKMPPSTDLLFDDTDYTKTKKVSPVFHY